MGICRYPHTAWRKLADETVVIDLKRKTMVGLNRSGGLIWEKLEQPQTYDQLRHGTNSSWSVPDIQEFCNQLVNLGLAEMSPHSQPALFLDSTAPADEQPLEQPAVLWTEAIQQAAGTCAFLPGEGQLCTQAPFN